MLIALDINFWSVLVAGLIAGYVMFFVDSYLKGFVKLFGMFPARDPWWFVTHEFDSIIFTLVYAAWFRPMLHAPEWQRGLIFGAVWWVIVTVGMFIAGRGGAASFRGMKASGAMLLSGLVLHLVWGLIIGVLYHP